MCLMNNISRNTWIKILQVYLDVILISRNILYVMLPRDLSPRVNYNVNYDIVCDVNYDIGNASTSC
jgi:hypothetical protein